MIRSAKFINEEKAREKRERVKRTNKKIINR
jgi:hypothetical protein